MREREEGEGGRRPPAGTEPRRSPRPRGAAPPERDHTLAELVSRVVDRGVVVTGEVVISVAGVDLVYLALDVLLAATDRLDGERRARSGPDGKGEESGGEGRAPGDDG